VAGISFFFGKHPGFKTKVVPFLCGCLDFSFGSPFVYKRMFFCGHPMTDLKRSHGSKIFAQPWPGMGKCARWHGSPTAIKHLRQPRATSDDSEVWRFLGGFRSRRPRATSGDPKQPRENSSKYSRLKTACYEQSCGEEEEKRISRAIEVQTSYGSFFCKKCAQHPFFLQISIAFNYSHSYS